MEKMERSIWWYNSKSRLYQVQLINGEKQGLTIKLSSRSNMRND